MLKRRVITNGILIVLFIICVIIDNYTGFDKGYFAISSASILAGYWTIEFLISLIYYCYDTEKEFKLFIAEKVNKTMLNYDDIKEKEKYYYKEFKRTRRKGKFICFMKLFFCMGLFIMLVTCLF